MAVLAGLSGVVGIVLDALALQSSTASTRERRHRRRQTRFVEGFAGDVFLGAAAGLAITAAIIVLVYRQDIFGATREEQPVGEAARAGQALGPRPRLEVRW